jgi:protocatechuate 3,4-dioxygenase beta subunit
MSLNRRDLLAKCMALGVVASTADLVPSVVAAASAQNETLRQLIPAAELERSAPRTNTLRAPGDPGIPLVVSGVFSTRGEAIPEAIVEIWQTNHLGIYDIDGYRYRAKLITNAEGKYDFSSVMPGHYPARLCQHVHYLVTAPGHQPLTTQLYFATDPVFEGNPDKNYARDPPVTSRELVRPVTLVGDPKEDIHPARFELVLDTL